MKPHPSAKYTEGGVKVREKSQEHVNSSESDKIDIVGPQNNKSTIHLLDSPRHKNNSFKYSSRFRSAEGLSALRNRTSDIPKGLKQHLRFSSYRKAHQQNGRVLSSKSASTSSCMIPYRQAAETKNPVHVPISNFQRPRHSILTLNSDPSQSLIILNLNVGGTVYKIKESSIKKAGNESRLTYFVQQEHDKRLNLCDSYFSEREEYFFERSAKLFDSVYKFYVTGHLHRPYDVCESEFLDELQFWRLPESLIASCCQPQFDLIDDSLDDLASSKKRRTDEKLRQRLHRFCEGDGTLASNIFTFLSICFVLISVFGLVLGSIEEFQIPYVRIGNQTVIAQNVTKSRSPPNVSWEPHWAFTYVELTCIIWFTLEYLLRLSVTPHRLPFMRGILNVVDLISIVPFYLELVLSVCGFDVDSLSDIKGAFLVVRIMRVLRVVRILKLSRYSTGMRTFALTLRSSARQLGMMGIVLFTGVVFFSTLLYFVEKDDPETPFTSIPDAFWWAIVTMSTVGYGDQIPRTVLGKTIASGAILSGVLVLALPITVIVDNFMKVSGSVQPRAMYRPKPSQSVPPSPSNNGTSFGFSGGSNEKTQLTSPV